MQYNSFRVQLDQLSAELERVRLANDKIHKDCLRYDQFDVAHVQSQIKLAATVVPERLEKCEVLTRRLTVVNAVSKDLSDRASIGINPLFWFSDERKRLLQQRDEAARTQAYLAEAVKTALASLQKAEKFFKQAKDALEWHTSFDRASDGAHVEALNRRIGEIERMLPAVRQKSDALDAELAPILLELNVQEARRLEAESRIASAERYEFRLNNASNSYEKRMAHEACRAELGNGSPSQVLGRSTRDKESAERSIGKIKKRLLQITERQCRRIDRLVFDGKNLCHDKQGEFIGLGALKAVVTSLHSEAKTIFVFDESIKSRHGFDEKRIRDALGTNITIHIVSGSADETVLNLAEGANDYVVSNDHFVEFRSKPAVRNHRIFPHEIVDNRVMIHALGVSASYA